MRTSSDSHRHDDVAVLVIVSFGGAELPGGLCVLQFQAHFAGAGGFQEVDQVLSVEAHRQGIRGIGPLREAISIRNRFGGGRRNLYFPLLTPETNSARSTDTSRCPAK